MPESSQGQLLVRDIFDLYNQRSGFTTCIEGVKKHRTFRATLWAALFVGTA